MTLAPSVEVPTRGNKMQRYLFGGYTAAPLGAALFLIAFVMATWPEQWQDSSFRLATVLPIFAVAAVVTAFIHRRCALGNMTSHGPETNRIGAVAKLVAGVLLVVAAGVLGNHIGLPLFELTIGLGLIRYGRQHKFYAALGPLVIIVAPFIWIRLSPSMIGSATFAILGFVFIVGGVFEQRFLSKEASS